MTHQTYNFGKNTLSQKREERERERERMQGTEQSSRETREKVTKGWEREGGELRRREKQKQKKRERERDRERERERENLRGYRGMLETKM